MLLTTAWHCSGFGGICTLWELVFFFFFSSMDAVCSDICVDELWLCDESWRQCSLIVWPLIKSQMSRWRGRHSARGSSLLLVSDFESVLQRELRRLQEASKMSLEAQQLMLKESNDIDQLQKDMIKVSWLIVINVAVMSVPLRAWCLLFLVLEVTCFLLSMVLVVAVVLVWDL